MSETRRPSRLLMQFRKPRALQPHAWLMTRALRRVLRTLAWLKIFKPTVAGRENVPAKGRAIVACNHRSMSDPVFLWGALRRNAAAIAMAELWRMPFVNILVWLLGNIPVNRGNEKSGRAAVKAGIRLLEHDGLLIIYPEGRCSRDGKLGRLYPGVVEMAIATGAPIVPAFIDGSELVKPLKGRGIHREHPVHLAFGPPINPGDFTGTDAERKIAMLAELREQILTLDPS